MIYNKLQKVITEYVLVVNTCFHLLPVVTTNVKNLKSFY